MAPQSPPHVSWSPPLKPHMWPRRRPPVPSVKISPLALTEVVPRLVGTWPFEMTDRRILARLGNSIGPQHIGALRKDQNSVHEVPPRMKRHPPRSKDDIERVLIAPRQLVSMR